MSLTFQPAAQLQKMEKLGEKLHLTVDKGNQILGFLTGVSLILSAFKSRGWSRIGLFASGTAAIIQAARTNVHPVKA